ncbi:hypothetical protein LCGC14_1342680 [marine sediment metagenome]|uniref:Uncharacterized protein n=1 Tax=marine sediment metagenome TaxID=412755 RepID=A0A0F9KZK7_9ZZZZ
MVLRSISINNYLFIIPRAKGGSLGPFVCIDHYKALQSVTNHYAELH